MWHACLQGFVVAPSFINYAPCLVANGPTGVAISPAGLVIQPNGTPHHPAPSSNNPGRLQSCQSPSPLSYWVLVWEDFLLARGHQAM